MKKYYLLGEKLSHSYSAVIHSFFGLDYSLRELPPEKLSEFVKSRKFDGLNVTMPYKKSIVPLLDEVDGIAEKTGAVNTVLNKNGKLIGYNTDYHGMKYALEAAKITLKGKDVLILGSGGAGIVAEKLAIDEVAASVEIVSRKSKLNYENIYDREKTQVIINATPVGTFPFADGAACDVSRFKNLEGAFDCVYNPFRSKFVLDAEKIGARACGGLTMLIAQAIYSEKIWDETTGGTAEKTVDGTFETANGTTETTDGTAEKTIDGPAETADKPAETAGGSAETADCENKIRAALGEVLKRETNISLVGMPGAGKTTVGRILAEKLGMGFCDTDEEIEKTAGESPEKIIEKYGEERFREIETEVAESVSALRGVVIATGGGTILREKNVAKLRSCGVVIWLGRDLNLLAKNNRPLSKSMPISRLFEQRKGYYVAASDKKIENDEAAEKTAEKIITEIFG